eukprot:CAMPEP_0180648018 /NCGR_PEP_ID=MMETSP1037_2-20121125/50687_1 /TAXON_ID=632150 /ORGANISM="Azadinium spinosum, Strain 3D9" /LENGTH=80 /DNA_ID=CAMNT_0022672691 /DNA_START=124 /DNA_END=362 /DNA_ORIENTATION=+
MAPPCHLTHLHPPIRSDPDAIRAKLSQPYRGGVGLKEEAPLRVEHTLEVGIRGKPAAQAPTHDDGRQEWDPSIPHRRAAG